MLGLSRQFFARHELLRILVVRNLKIRYKNSALGFFWTLLAPLFLILIYATFLHVMRFNIELPVLVTGIIVWQFLSMCLGDSLHAVLGNANLVTKAAFPRLILPVSMVGANLVNFLLAFAVLCVYLVVVGAPFCSGWLLPLAMLTQLALCLGVSLIVSTSNVFFRDTEHIMGVIQLAWFFLTPIIYPIGLVMDGGFPAWVPVSFFLNPMTGIVTTYRMALLGAPSPGTPFLLISFCMSWLVFLVGLVAFRLGEPRFGDEL